MTGLQSEAMKRMDVLFKRWQEIPDDRTRCFVFSRFHGGLKGRAHDNANWPLTKIADELEDAIDYFKSNHQTEE